MKGADLVAEGQGPVAAQELSKVFRGPIIAAGGFDPEAAETTVANGDANLITFGRHFISNPYLPRRIEFGLPLNPYDRSTFYAFDGRGYTDYPAYDVRKLEETCVIEKIPLGTSSGEELPPGPQRFKSRAGANG
jgi:N-ethylmaleimide reductase